MFDSNFHLFLKQKLFTIAIDGPACAGKSSLGKKIATFLGINLLDSGLLYRFFVYHYLQTNSLSHPVLSKEKWLQLCADFSNKVTFSFSQNQFFYQKQPLAFDLLYNNQIEKAIPFLVNNKWLRFCVTQYCQNLLKKKSFVLLGRDAGTQIAPQADLKFYLDAQLAVRIARKKKQLQELKFANPAIASVAFEHFSTILKKRDQNDLSRPNSPLKLTADYIKIDNSTSSFNSTYKKVLAIVYNQLKLLLPKITIIGAPNVGKSSLFNLLTSTKDALVSQIEGTTRDPYHRTFILQNQHFTLVDTSGLTIKKDAFSQILQTKTERIINQSDLLLWMVDATSALTSDDLLINKLISKKKAKTFLLLNKVDLKISSANFLSLAVKKNFFFSIKTRLNYSLLLKEIINFFDFLPVSTLPSSDHQLLQIAIIGKPNVGKSTFFNQIFSQELATTSPHPHTTTNFTNKAFFYKNYQLLFYDTAGVRKKTKKISLIEKKAKAQLFAFLPQTDFVLMLTTFEENGFTTQDKKMMALIAASQKPFLLIINKKDLVTLTFSQIEKLTATFFPYFKKRKPEILLISALKEKLSLSLFFEKIITLYLKTKDKFFSK